MKIQCDACGREQACLFCPADEAALCETCDHRVHRANKLARQHTRFSLLHPSSFNEEAPRCDICQDRRGFLFCQEDRAILCRECDIPIHKVNEHTQKHNRFLLTGVKLSDSSSSSYSISSSSETCNNMTAQSEINNNNNNNVGLVIDDYYDPSPAPSLPPSTSTASGADEGSISTDQYLIDTFPEWQFDEFIDPSSFNNGSNS